MRSLTLLALVAVVGCNPSFPEGVIVLGDDTGEDCHDCGDADTDTDSDTDSDTDTDTAEDTSDSGVNTDPYAEYIWIAGSEICFSADGFNLPYDSSAAYVVGYGDGLDWTLKASHAISPVDGSYCLDTAAWEYDTYEATLISSLQSDGSLTTTYANTGDWWDNFDFCTSGFPTALSYCNAQEDGNFLVKFEKTKEGLVPAGDIVE